MRQPTMNEMQLDHFAALRQQAATLAHSAAAPWFAARQARAWEHCKALGWPSSKDEAWKYLNVKPITQTAFTLPTSLATPRENLPAELLLPSAGARLVFVNGHFAPALSTLAQLDERIVIKPWQQACNEHRQELENVLERLDQQAPHDTFTYLNEALLSGGLFIAVPAGERVTEPIQIVHLARKGASLESAAVSQQLRFVVHLGKGAELTLSSLYLGLEQDKTDTYCTNGVWDFVLETEAKARFFQQQAESVGALHFAAVRVLQARLAEFKAAQLSLGAALSRVQINVIQQGSEARSHVDSLMLAQGEQQSEVKTTVHHQAAFGSSNQYHKAVLGDQARGIFHGLIKIHHAATKTNAGLLNKNLLLSAGCEIDTRPQLEIDTDDVKCSHGATVSQLQAEEVFYLQSRGIPALQAKALLSQAYVAEFLQRLDDSGVMVIWKNLLARFVARQAAQGSRDQ